MIGAAALLCLTQAVYFESRGEPVAGQYAVAEVVMNRVASSQFPNNVCAVTKQDLGPKRYDCQFSYECDGVSETMREGVARSRAERIALEVAGGGSNLTNGALYFHAGKKPSWAYRFTQTFKVGRHYFYRP